MEWVRALFSAGGSVSASSCDRQLGKRGLWIRGGVLSLLTLSACAARQGDTKHAAQRTAMYAEVATLKKAVAERDRTLNELENRLALLEAEQRQLRYALADTEPRPLGIRETVRIGAKGSHAETERPPSDFVAAPEPMPARERAESRPILRLVGERRHSSAEPLMPIPVVSERLPVAPLPEAGSLAVGGETPLDASSHYRAAIDLVRQREFDAALASLTEFLVRYPSDGRAPKVMFWRGEVLFAQRDYARALTAFESSLAKQPIGDRAPDALLKVGLCHKRLGAPERARAVIERLKAQFPQSDAARLAAQEDA